MADCVAMVDLKNFEFLLKGLAFFVMCIPKDYYTGATLKTYISDSIGSVQVTAFGLQVEQLLGLRAEEIHSFKLNVEDDALDGKLNAIKQREMLIHISPTYDLSLSNTLKWVVHVVEPIPLICAEQGDEVSNEVPTNSNTQEEIVTVQPKNCLQEPPNSSNEVEQSVQASAQIELLPVASATSAAELHQSSTEHDHVPVKLEEVDKSVPGSSVQCGYGRPHGKSPLQSPATPSHAFAEESDDDFIDQH